MRAALLVAFLAAPAFAAAQSAPPSLAPDASLFLELVVNGVASGRVVRVDSQSGRFFIAVADLRAVSLQVEGPGDVRIATDTLAGVHAVYDGYDQRLALTVPLQWFPVQEVGTRARGDGNATTSAGFVLGYEVFARGGTGGRLSAWSEQRLFDRWGTITNTGVLSWPVAGRETGRSPAKYVRYDTTWTHADEASLRTYTVGDLVTGALPWTSAVRVGGVSISRSFQVRPDLVTYPVPKFAGAALVPSSVDLLIDGRSTAHEQVGPGSFVLNDLPMVTGAGTATLVTTDALGRRSETDVAFYVASNLLRRGLSDYSFSVGAVRTGYGLNTFGYDKPAASATYRYGVSNFATMAGHAEAGRGLFAAGVGADLRLGLAGVVGASVSRGAQASDSGWQHSMSYAYASRRFSVSVRRTERTAEFWDLATYAVGGLSLSGIARRTVQATGAVSVGRRIGTVAGGYFATLDHRHIATRVASVSYQRIVMASSSLQVGVNHRSGGQRAVAAQATLVVPLGRFGNGTFGAQRSAQASGGARGQFTRNAPPAGGVGWNVGYAGGQDLHQASLTWRSSAAVIEGGLQGPEGQRSGWFALSGSAIVAGRRLHLANRVSDAFVVVDTSGIGDVPVLFENQLVGRTNRAGRLLVPWVNGYYQATYGIDTLQLDPDVRAETTTARVAVRKRHGAIIRFPMVRVLAASVALVDTAGEPIVVGSIATDEMTGSRAVVGWDGIVYVEGLRLRNRLVVTGTNGQACVAEFDLPSASRGLFRIGPVVCR